MSAPAIQALVEAQFQALLAQHPKALLHAPDTAAIAKTAHGHFAEWLEALRFPDAGQGKVDLQSGCVRAGSDADSGAVEQAVELLMPWRKGPFCAAGVDIESEWRSDLKYQRLLDLGFDPKGRRVLDVGTGNGYFLYRLLGSGAQLAAGLDPSWHNFVQFLFLQQFFQQERAVYLPAVLETAPLTGFDSVLCMGVLYHRRDPLAFLQQLAGCVQSGGTAVIETLVIEGGENAVYLPDERYAGMRNVWFLPSVPALCKWLKRLNFNVIAAGEPVLTTPDEQRRTRHMQRHSFAEFMAEHGAQPAPMRAMVLVQKR